MVKVSNTPEVTLSFDTVAAAEAGDTGASEYIVVAGVMYVYDAAGTDLITGDGRTWARHIGRYLMSETAAVPATPAAGRGEMWLVNEAPNMAVFTDDVGNNRAMSQWRKTWTPELTFGGASTGITYGSRSGTYLVTGNLVNVFFTLTLTSKGTATGDAEVSMPSVFPLGLTVQGYFGGGFIDTFWYMSGLPASPQFRTLTSTFRLTCPSATYIDNITDAHFTNTSSIACTGAFLLS